MPFAVDDRAVGIGNRHDLAALAVQTARGVAADVAVALDGERRAGDCPLEPGEDLAGDDRDAVARGGLAAGRAVKLHRLAGDARRLNPSNLAYSFMIQAMTWASVPMSGAGMSLIGADQVVDFLDESAGQPFEFAPGKLVGVAVHAALGAAEGKVDNGRFPGHQAGQGACLVLVDVRMKAQARP